MKTGLYNRLNALLGVLASPAILHFYYQPSVGASYDFGFFKKRRLHRRILRITQDIQSATSPIEHLVLASSLLSIPPGVKGDIIECGCFKGSSTSTLSLLAEATARNLVVCDSFAGLPEIGAGDRLHVSEMLNRFESYEKGEYCGALEEVQENVSRYGAPGICRWERRYFEDTLPQLDDRYAFAFLDVDLFDSLKTCLTHIWPRMSEDAILFTHEARQIEFTKTFFDDNWWMYHLDRPAPGLVGAGSGVPAGISTSTGLGWIKKTSLKTDDRIAQISRFQGDPTRNSTKAGSTA